MTYKNLMSSDFQDWATPQSFIEWLQIKFNMRFDLDVCATDQTAKVPMYYTPEDDAFQRDWVGHCWMNPPYDNQREWLEYADLSVHHPLETARSVWCLIPARTDTKLFHDFIAKRAHTIYLIKGRINFNRPNRASDTGSTHPSMLVVFKRRAVRGKRTRQRYGPRILLLDVPPQARRGQE